MDHVDLVEIDLSRLSFIMLRVAPGSRQLLHTKYNAHWTDVGAKRKTIVVVCSV